MGEVSTIGLDIAKSVFQVHGVDVDGTVVIRGSGEPVGSTHTRMRAYDWDPIRAEH